MSELRVLGVYDEGLDAPEATERRNAIKLHCKQQVYPAPSFESPDFFEATVVGHDLTQQGNQVVLVGHIADLHIPPPDVLRHNVGAFTTYEWRESWLAYLEERALGWSPVGSMTDRKAGSTTNRQSIIRSYQRSCATLARLLARIRGRRKVGVRSKEPGYVYGRPPYGYRVVGGHLAIDTERVELVRSAFKMLKSGMATTEVAKALQEMDKGRDGQREYWDPVKIRRILKHAPLYCFGEYTSPLGEVIRLPSLAILPKEFSRVATARNPRAIPKKTRSGTLGAHASATTH